MSSPKGNSDKKPWRSEGEIFALIDLYRERYDALEHKLTPNQPIYVEIASNLKEAGYPRTAYQVQRKIANLRKEYRDIKKDLVTGSPTPTWPYYNAMHEILHGRPAENPDVQITDEIGMEDDGKENDVENPPVNRKEVSESNEELVEIEKDSNNSDVGSPPPKKRGRVSEQLLSVCKASLKLMEKSEARRNEERKKLDEQSDKFIELMAIMASSVQALANKKMTENE